MGKILIKSIHMKLLALVLGCIATTVEGTNPFDSDSCDQIMDYQYGQWKRMKEFQQMEHHMNAYQKEKFVASQEQMWYDSEVAHKIKDCHYREPSNPWHHHHSHPVYTGVNVTKPTSHNGKWDITVNWKKVMEYDREWAEWFRSEARTPEARQMLDALNHLGKQVYHEVAVRQSHMMKTASKEFDTFMHWLEPGSQCDAFEFLHCLQESDSYHFNVYETHCAHESNCRPHLYSREKKDDRKALRHGGHDLEKAAKQLMNEMVHSFHNTMSGQEENARQIAKDYLQECRKQWTKWGCNEKCVDKATRSFNHLGEINKCDCPDYITVSGDTKDLFH